MTTKPPVPTKTRGKGVVLRDPRAIKALAHPARLDVLDKFMSGSELTATEAAAIAGLSPSAMSYHLRELAKWQIITPVESADGRERRWKMTAGGFSIEPENHAATQAAEVTLISRMLDRQRADALAWFNHQDDEAERWRDLATIVGSHRWLSAEEAEEVVDIICTALDKYRDRTLAEHPEGTRRVQMGFIAFPDARDIGAGA